MNTTKQPPVATIAAKPKNDFVMLGGGQKEVSQEDLEFLTTTVRVNVECKTDEKEVTATVPIYEVPLLQARYRSLGGEARLVAQWLPAKMKYTRIIPLSLDMLRDEVTRLEGSYVVFLQNGGKKSLFKEIYGKNGDPIKGFYRCINLQSKAWKGLNNKIRDGHRLIDEDLVAISNLALPQETFERPERQIDISDATMEGDDAAPDTDGSEIADPMADLQTWLSEKNWDSEIIMDLCRLLGDGVAVTQVNVKDLPSLHGKRGQQTRLLADFKSFMAHAEKKAAQQATEAARVQSEKDAAGELTK